MRYVIGSSRLSSVTLVRMHAGETLGVPFIAFCGTPSSTQLVGFLSRSVDGSIWASSCDRALRFLSLASGYLPANPPARLLLHQGQGHPCCLARLTHNPGGGDGGTGIAWLCCFPPTTLSTSVKQPLRRSNTLRSASRVVRRSLSRQPLEPPCPPKMHRQLPALC